MKLEYNVVILITVLVISVNLLQKDSSAESHPYSSNPGQNFISTNSGSPIEISRDSFSPTSEVHILIHAPDFNSNQYAIDTIGNDGENTITISTREGSIPYKLVETGFDTGDFAGYVTLSGTTSICSPICGPTDGFLAAGGDDAISVSFTYAGDRTYTVTSPGVAQSPIENRAIPEFGPLSEMIVTISLIAGLIISIRIQSAFKI